MTRTPRITLLAGGVGGAKAALGLYLSEHKANLSVIGNVADDEEFHGLWVSPDIDTLTYTLAGRINQQQGWGLENETHQVLDGLQQLGSDTWMFLGDQDFTTHIYRTEQRRKGIRPSAIAQDIAWKNGVDIPLLLPTDDVMQTRVLTAAGSLSFQEYFVREQCNAEITAIAIEGSEQAAATPEALEAIHNSDLIIIAPSNPVVSIGAILAVTDIRHALEETRATRIAISPFIAGKTVKGPADDMMQVIGLNSSPASVAELYQDCLDAMIVDTRDASWEPVLQDRGLDVLVTDTLMKTDSEKTALMQQCVHFGQQVSTCKQQQAARQTNEKEACL